MGRVGVGRMRRMGIACMGSGGGHRKNAEDGMGRMGRMGVACLGSGGGHRKAHEDARNQQQSSFHGHKPSKLQTQDCFLAHFFMPQDRFLAQDRFLFFRPVIADAESPDACKEWNWNTFGG